MIGLVGVHRAELVDLDQLVVEAVALLLEEHRAAAVELDGERRRSASPAPQRSAQGRRRSCRTAISSRRPSRRSAGRTRRAPARCRDRNRSAGGTAACWCAPTSRMSTGSTHSFFSICRMRPSAEIGSEKITRSTRVRRANSTRSSTVPSLRTPAAACGERSSPRSSNRPMTRTSVSRWSRIAADQRFAGRAAADDRGAAGEPAFAGPAPHQQEQRAAESQQRRRGRAT